MKSIALAKPANTKETLIGDEIATPAYGIGSGSPSITLKV